MDVNIKFGIVAPCGTVLAHTHTHTHYIYIYIIRWSTQILFVMDLFTITQPAKNTLNVRSERHE